MKQDLKHIINSNKRENIELPKAHREEFLKKLKRQNKETSRLLPWLKVASAVLIFLTIGVISIMPRSSEVKKESLMMQIKEVEKDYLRRIETEWQNFISVSTDDRLKQRFEVKLEELHVDYLQLTSQFQKDPNNLLILGSLVENLQTRLQLLKDIQEHINLINQQNEQHENNM